MKGFILCVLISWLASSSAENDTQTSFLNPGNDILLPSPLGEYCWDKICAENQFCSELLICQCCQGFRNFDGYCIPCAGENEKCETTDDCCGRLICIKGICRKPRPNIEFVTLAKICLAITATTVMIAVFTYLLKCLIRYGRVQSFRHQDDTASLNSIQAYMRQLMHHRPPSYEVEQEKPPSYEECVRTSGRPPINEPPPPYVISTNIPPPVNGINSQRVEESNIRSQTLTTTPLNVQSLEHSVNPNQHPTQDEQSDRNLQKATEARPS